MGKPTVTPSHKVPGKLTTICHSEGAIVMSDDSKKRQRNTDRKYRDQRGQGMVGPEAGKNVQNTAEKQSLNTRYL